MDNKKLKAAWDAVREAAWDAAREADEAAMKAVREAEAAIKAARNVEAAWKAAREAARNVAMNVESKYNSQSTKKEVQNGK